MSEDCVAHAPLSCSDTEELSDIIIIVILATATITAFSNMSLIYLLRYVILLPCIVIQSFSATFNPLKGTLKPRSNGPLYSNTVIGTLVVDGWAVTFGTARRGLGGLGPRPVPSSLYQMQQPTHQRPVYQLHIV